MELYYANKLIRLIKKLSKILQIAAIWKILAYDSWFFKFLKKGRRIHNIFHNEAENKICKI